MILYNKTGCDLFCDVLLHMNLYLIYITFSLSNYIFFKFINNILKEMFFSLIVYGLAAIN